MQAPRFIRQDGQGGLPMVGVETAWSTAEIYLLGACVTHFQKHGEPPLLFLSAKSRFQDGAPIRGGIPIIFPWFGSPAGRPGQHGFARVRAWELTATRAMTNGVAEVRLQLPASAELPDINVDYIVTVGQTLGVELLVENHSQADLTFEDCLHTYFNIGDITAAGVSGLRGVEYLDSADGFARKRETADTIRFTAETDRAYLDTKHTTEIRDDALHRVIRVEKSGSRSTVVWNPWIAKAKAMADFGDDEYRTMVCVESGNVKSDAITLPPGGRHALKVELSHN